MELLKGQAVSDAIKQEIADAISNQTEHVPTLATVRIGERADDVSYEKGATKKLTGFGLTVKNYVYAEDITSEEFEKEYKKIMTEDDIDGVLLFRPFPKHIDERQILAMTDPDKDIDGMTSDNMAKVYSGDESGYAPCTPSAVMELLKYYKVPIRGKRVVIVGRSMVVGKPLAMLMLKENATVTVCHTKTENLQDECKKAEILVVCAGKEKIIDASYVSDGTVVIDVGIHVGHDGKLCGDVDSESVSSKASMLTPVPGGIGTVTTALLAKHLLQANIKKYRT